MEKGTLNFGLVGAGGIAQTYAQVFHSLGDADLAGVADVRLDVAQAMAEGAGCRAFDSHGTLAENVALDAVIICTPPSTHAELCRFFLERGTPVLCEKPLALETETAKSLVTLAEEQNVLFTMASKFRYVEDMVRAKSIVTSGILGEVVLFENAFTAHVDMSHRWNSNPDLSGGGVIIDNGTHSVDIMRYFLGPVAEVFAVEGKRVQSVAVEDTARVFVRSLGGVLGTIDLSWSINKELDSYVDIYGSNGVIRVGWRESKYRQLSSQDWIKFGSGYDKFQAIAAQLRNFCRAIRGEDMLLITGEDAIASVEVIESVYRSVSEGTWTPVHQERRSQARATASA